MGTSPRGRRPAGSKTREAILAAARRRFSEQGYRGSTLRDIAREAGVDHRLVLHYFGSKQGLFMATVRLPIEPETLLSQVFAEDAAAQVTPSLGHRVAETLLAVLDDPVQREVAIGVIRAATSEPEAAALIRQVLTERVLLPLTRQVGGDHPQLRASLVAAQFVGVVMARYVVAIEPLASLPRPDVVRAIGPVFDHYLFGTWTTAGPGRTGTPASQASSGSPS